VRTLQVRLKRAAKHRFKIERGLQNQFRLAAKLGS